VSAPSEYCGACELIVAVTRSDPTLMRLRPTSEP